MTISDEVYNVNFLTRWTPKASFVVTTLINNRFLSNYRAWRLFPEKEVIGGLNKKDDKKDLDSRVNESPEFKRYANPHRRMGGGGNGRFMLNG